MDYEKLGAFYLGRLFDHKKGETTDAPLLYDSKDLTTHAVCLGMTGSGKTGLCISLLEEAAIDGIPAIAIDPKGDLGNLALTFPGLSAEEFKPWIDPADATRKAQTIEESAEATAKLWRNGLAKWGQGPERIAKLRNAAEVCIYTPGSNAGRNITVLRSFDPPPAEVIRDSEALREQVSSSASGLLALLGISIDPLRSKEHILVSTILLAAWTKGESLDLAGMIRAIQTPPFERVGVMDLELFYPSKERSELAMSINGLLASPAFAGWLEGEPLNIKKLLWTDKGKARISIINIAHLSESERMFFVTILLGEMVSWMRSQSGTSSLRALLYMDEVFGFFPPVANPPSKKPMLTLLKQARAYGLGVVLATQNPVDLDYKGLSNTGTWFIGRLQTERDVARVVDGLEGAATASGQKFSRAKMTALIAGLDSRVFIMNNVHENAQVSFKTRWALSYLRGPLTRDHIRALTPKLDPDTARAAKQGKAGPQNARSGRTADRENARSSVPLPPSSTELAAQPLATEDTVGRHPDLPPEIEEYFTSAPNTGGSAATYHPEVFGSVELHYTLARQDLDEWVTVYLRAPLDDESRSNPWTDSDIAVKAPSLSGRESDNGGYQGLPAFALRPKSYAAWGKKLKTHVYKSCTLTLFKCTKLKLISHMGEDEVDFRVRVRDVAREKRDIKVEKLRAKFGKKLTALHNKAERAEIKLETQESQLSQAKTGAALSAGTTLLGALFGRKMVSIGNVSRAGSTIKRASKIKKESNDVVRAKDKVAELETQLQELESDFQYAILEASELSLIDDYPITTKELHPRKSDIEVTKVALLWNQR
ncbi:MAG: ATP-binding protein [Kofleriaceae bacterium]|nr:ATP-binding protein [Kofleriaceae bacterium]